MPNRATAHFARVMLYLPAIIAALGGCTRHHYTPLSTHEAGYRYEPPSGADPVFGIDPSSMPDVSLRPAGMELGGYEVLALSFDSVGRNGQPGNRVDALYYRSRKEGPRKLIVVLPIWGSYSYPPTKISEGYARHSEGDAHVIRVIGTNGIYEWERLAAAEHEGEFVALATLMTERFTNTVRDVRRLLAWAGARPEVDASRRGVVGFSMSALVAAIVVGSDPEVETAVLMMGGARPGEIFTECRSRVGAVRDHAVNDLGWTLEQYRAFFTDLLAAGDPARFAGHYNPARILMIDAARDDCMPEVSRAALWEATGRPERISFLYSHKKAFLSMTPLGFNYTRGRIYNFLDRAL